MEDFVLICSNGFIFSFDPTGKRNQNKKKLKMEDFVLMCSSGFIFSLGPLMRLLQKTGVTSGMLVVHSLFDCVLLAACSQHTAFMPDVKKRKKGCVQYGQSGTLDHHCSVLPVRVIHHCQIKV